MKKVLRLKTYLLFSTLYFVQGAVQSYLSNFQKPLLVTSGVSLDQIAILSSAMLLPFSVKMLLGLVSDRFVLFGDHRKSYMISGLALAAACYCALGLVDIQTQYTLFFVLICLSSFGMAFFDTCADGLAVDIGKKNEEGTIQASMMFGRGVGYILLSFTFGQLAARIGYTSVFLTLASLISIAMLFVIFQVPQVHHADDRKKKRPWHWRKVWQEHGSSLLFVCLYAVLYSITSFGVDGITTLLVKMKLGLTDDVLGNMGSFQGVGTLIGAVLAATVIYKLSMKRAAILAVALLTLGASLMPTIHDPLSAYGMSTLWGVFWAFQETVFLALCMQVAKGEYAATLFAGLMMFSNIGTSIGEWTSAKMIEATGLDSTFLYLAGANLLLIPLLLIYFRNVRLPK